MQNETDTMTPKLERVLFVHDHVFRYLDDGQILSPGAFTTAVWDRYQTFCNHLTVVARGQRINTADLSPKMQRVNHNRVSFEQLPNIMSPTTFLSGRPKVKARLRTLIEQADGVICRLPSVFGLMATDICEEIDKPYFIEVAGDVWDALWHRGSLLGKLYTPYQTYLVKRAIKRAPHVIYVTRDALQRRYPTDGTTTHASNVVLPTIEPKIFERRKTINARIDGQITLGIIGPPELRYKGLHLAAPTLRKLRESGIDLELRLLGQGDPASVKNYLDKLGIAAFTRFDGTLPGGSAVFSWLDDIQIYMQPSLQEGLPRATIEAMSRGCVAVGSDVAGIPELLEPSCIFSRRTSEDLFGILERLCRDRSSWDAISERNLKEAEDYTIARIDGRRGEFYRSFTAAALSR